MELLDAVARVMGLKIQRVLQLGGDDRAALDSGRADIFQTYVFTPEREQFVAFSASYLELSGGLFINKNPTGIHHVDDLDNRRVLVVGLNSVGERFVRKRIPHAQLLYATSGEEALVRLEAGEADALFLSRLTALSVIEYRGLHNIMPLGEPITGYEVPLCFAVRRGDSVLLARLNEGLAILHRTGEYDRIYRKWFGRFDSAHFSREEMIFYLAGALALALAVALRANFHQRQLHRRIARQAADLAESQAILAEAQAFASIGHWRKFEDGTVSWSEETFRILERDPLLGSPADVYEVIRHAAAADQDRWRDGLAALQANGQPLWLELELSLPSGHRKYLQTRTRPAGDKFGNPGEMFGTIQDVTERRQHDEEISQGRRLRALGELVGGIAHEFNNLLTPILFNADELQREWAEQPRLSAELGLIADAAHRSAELTRRLLAFGRKTDVQAETFDVATVVENNIALLRHTNDRRIVLESQLSATLPKVYLCLGDLQQILLNLMVNARDSLVERLGKPASAQWIPRILIAARPTPRPAALPPHAPATEDWLSLSIQDNGMGMTPEVVERIFEPFFSTKDTGKGTGLGLATVWHLVNEFGGRVMVASDRGVGTTFTVYLPVCPAPVTPTVSRPPSTPPVSDGTMKRILLVEDEASISLLLQKLLQRYGHKVTAFANGMDSWKRLAESPRSFDLLLLDLNTPGLTGVELALRARELRFSGPIIVMSGRVSEEERAALNRLKVDTIIAKPFTIGTFTAALNSLGIATDSGLV